MKSSRRLAAESAWQARLGALVESLVCRTLNTVHQREGDVGLKELLDLGAKGLRRLNLLALNDMNRAEPGAMTTRHLLVHLLHGVILCQSRELLVHVRRPRSRVVTKPNAILRHLLGLFLENLLDA